MTDTIRAEVRRAFSVIDSCLGGAPTPASLNRQERNADVMLSAIVTLMTMWCPVTPSTRHGGNRTVCSCRKTGEGYPLDLPVNRVGRLGVCRLDEHHDHGGCRRYGPPAT